VVTHVDLVSMKISQALLFSVLLQASKIVQAHTTNGRSVTLRGEVQATPDSASERVSVVPAYHHANSSQAHQLLVDKLKVDDNGEMRWEAEGIVEEWATWPSWVLSIVIATCFVLGAFQWWQLRNWDSTQPSQKDTLLPDPSGLIPAIIEDQKDIERNTIRWQMYFAIGFWYCLLIANAASVRLFCKLGIPRDCHERTDSVRGLESMDKLLSHGFILAILVALPTSGRFHYLFNFTKEGNFRGAIFLVVFFATAPIYGSLDLIPALSTFSLTSGVHKSPLFWLLVFALLVGSAVLVLFHIYWAARYGTWQGFCSYVGSRAMVISMYVLYFNESGKYATMSFHLHHYMVGFLLAILATFDHMLSLLLLAIASGIFVQGLAAYNADPLIYRQA